MTWARRRVVACSASASPRQIDRHWLLTAFVGGDVDRRGRAGGQLRRSRPRRQGGQAERRKGRKSKRQTLHGESTLHSGLS
jgi:hypothetical protein